jgi:NAD(P)H-dependent flavin oxidoreductase YrpB (nitropropane dioxygenase family)
MSKLPELKIKDLTIFPPIIQGGMGVQISGPSLASAVCKTGAVGTLAAIGLGEYTDLKTSYTENEGEALRKTIKEVRKNSPNGVLAVNMMSVVSSYSNLVKIAVEEKVDIIISGAGLPLDLPEYAKDSNVKLIPIVSSDRALKVIYKTWTKKYNKIPDAIIVEGPKAGGHLGYKLEEIDDPNFALEKIIPKIIDCVKEIEKDINVKIPVIAAGGIFDGKDIAKFIKLGCSGVQMASRFVCTHECDAHDNFKNAYINAKEEDIVIIKSPVGLPGRAIKNDFIEKVKRKEKTPFKCSFRCLKACNPSTVPYCIAEALWSAKIGKTDNGVIFAGKNAYRINKIISVNELIEELIKEAEENL